MYTIYEGIEKGDLKRLVKPILSIDTYRSKMGEDKDICVISFTVFGKEPATDLVNFIEKSYDWVLDGDISSGEASDGNYLVFIEIERSPKVAEHIVVMLDDMRNLTDQKVDEWKFTYYKGNTEYPVDKETLLKHILTTPEKYQDKMDELEHKETNESLEMNALRAIAGVPSKPAKVSKDMRAIQQAAGIL